MGMSQVIDFQFLEGNHGERENEGHEGKGATVRVNIDKEDASGVKKN